jgi:hypothetical protein
MRANSSIAASLLAASFVSALVFALPWLRITDLSGSLGTALGAFLLYGALICVLAFVVGFPVAYLVAKLHAVRWWVSTPAAALLGVALSWVFTHGGEGNPFAVSFSPWTRDRPGIINDAPFTRDDFVGSVIFGAIVGAAFGLAFWASFVRALRPNKSLERTRDR